MTSDRQKILDIINTPKTREGLSEKLCSISDAFLGFRDAGGGISTAMDEDWKGIHDLLLYMDRAEAKVSMDGVPQTDPLTAITAAERYQALSPEAAGNLRGDFMRQVLAITGDSRLEERQIKKLFRLFTAYNPVLKLDMDKGPKP